MMTARKPYPSDVSDDEWALVAPYLTLLPESAKQREHPLREVFNGLRCLVRYGVAWRAIPPLAFHRLSPIEPWPASPNDLPPWHAVYEQAQRWLRAGCFEMLAHDLRAVLRLASGRNEDPMAVLDSRTLRSTPESGALAAWDGHKRTRGSKLHLAVDTMGHLPALHVTPANENDRVAVDALAEAVQDATGESVTLAYVDQGYTGERAAKAAQAHGIALEVVKLADAKCGFVLLPRRGDGFAVLPFRGIACGDGRRAILRLDCALPQAGTRLRTPARNPGRTACHRLRYTHAQTCRYSGRGP